MAIENNYMYKPLSSNDIVSKTLVKTYGLWSDSVLDANTLNESVLYSSSMYLNYDETSSLEGNYYLNVYQQPSSSNLNSPVQFSIALGSYGAKLKPNSADEIAYTYPTCAVYNQFANLLLGENEPTASLFKRHVATGSSTLFAMPLILAISIGRERLKDGLENNTWQLNMYGNDLTAVCISLIADTGSNDGVSYPVVGGVLSGAKNANDGKGYGICYPEYGIIILDAVYISGDLGNTAGPFVCDGAPEELGIAFNFIKDGNYFKARSVERVSSQYYFCKMNHDEFNLSTNPTWVSGSNSLILPAFLSEKKTFITTIGLYDDTNVLVGTAKLSRPIAKDETKEANVTVRLDF